jgi:hypothetical protein
MKIINQLIHNKRIRLSIVLLISGSLFLVWGIDIMFFDEPSVFFDNYRYQIIVSNGTLQLIIGIGFLIGGIIHFRTRNVIEKPKTKEKRQNWLKHY